MKKLLCLAAFIYLLVAPLTYHPDNKLVLFWAGLEHGTVWDIWKYGQEHLSPTNQFNYPPVHFYLDKLQYGAARLVAGDGFDQWLSVPNSNDAHESNLVRYTFAIKLVLMVFSLIVGYLIYLLGKQYSLNEKQSLLSASLWLFNPIVIYSIPIMGQNDVMAIMLFLVGWLLLARSQLAAGIIFGLSASVKMYPLLWLPFLLLADKTMALKNKIMVFVLGLGLYLLTLTPFIPNPVFREAVLNSDINDRFFIGQINLGFSEAIMVVPVLLIVVFFGLASFKKVKLNDKSQLELQSLAGLICNLSLLGFSHFHPQWFTWLIPFWALWLLVQKRFPTMWVTLLSVLSFGAWLLVVLLFQDSYLSLGLLTPLNSAFANLPSIYSILSAHAFDIYKFNSFAHTWLAGITTILIIALFTTTNDVEGDNSFSLKIPPVLKNKYLVYSTILVISMCLIFFITLASYLVPAPHSSLSPVIAGYAPLIQPMEYKFSAEKNNLNRVDLYFRNPDLKNADMYIVEVKEINTAEPLHTQRFSGTNTSDPGMIRFDFLPQVDSKGKEYIITIQPEAISLPDSPYNLRIAVSESSDISVKSYYSAEKGLQPAFSNTIDALKNVMYQVPLVYILALILLVFAL